MIKERPIIMTNSSVRAILEDRKFQTRRVMKPQPYFSHDNWWFEKKGMVYALPNGKELCTPALGIWDVCPYGRAGDRLWVKETWRIAGWADGEPYYLQYKSDMTCQEEPGYSGDYDIDKYIQYGIDCSEDCRKAGFTVDEETDMFLIPDESMLPTRWRPSRFMPRWASRILLEITDIRVERVQDISEQDALAEGVDTSWHHFSDGVNFKPTAQFAFANLWDKINSKRGFGWDSNPWLWVVAFKVVKS